MPRNDNEQFAQDTRDNIRDIAATPEGRQLLLEQAAALGANNPVAGPSAVDVQSLVEGITKAVAETFKAQAAAEAAKKSKKRDADSDKERENAAKRLKEDPIPAPLSRPFGKGAFSKDEDVLFSNEGNAIHKKEM